MSSYRACKKISRESTGESILRNIDETH